MSDSDKPTLFQKIQIILTSIVITALGYWGMLETEGWVSFMLCAGEVVLLWICILIISYGIFDSAPDEDYMGGMLFLCFFLALIPNIYVSNTRDMKKEAAEAADLAAKEQVYTEVVKSWEGTEGYNEKAKKIVKNVDRNSGVTQIIITGMDASDIPATLVEQQ